MDEPVFLSYSSYLKQYYPKPVYRVGVDAGFGCPLREEGRCVYCDAHSARPAWLRNKNHDDLRDTEMARRLEAIKAQVEAGVAFLRRRYKAEGFILYFQAGTNTNAGLEELKKVYDYALGLADFSGFAVSTRPDCLSEPVLDLLASYRKETRGIEVELGLQSANDLTLRRINRGHDRDCFLKAYLGLKERGIPVIVHLMLGLPGEGPEELAETVDFVAGLKPLGVKLHNLHIPRQSPLFQDYLRGELSVLSSRRYLESLLFVLERLPRTTVILRLSADTPGGPAAPRYFWDKSRLSRSLTELMKERNTWQGRLRGE